MRRSRWIPLALLCAPVISLPAQAAHVNEADLRRPQEVMLQPDPAWALPPDRGRVEAPPPDGYLKVMLAGLPPEVAEPLRGRLEYPILVQGALQAAAAASSQARRKADAPVPEPGLRAQALNEQQMATMALIGLGVLILAGSAAGLIARTPGGMGGASRA